VYTYCALIEPSFLQICFDFCYKNMIFPTVNSMCRTVHTSKSLRCFRSAACWEWSGGRPRFLFTGPADDGVALVANEAIFTSEVFDGIGGVPSVVCWPALTSQLSVVTPVSITSVDTVVEDVAMSLGTALGLLLVSSSAGPAAVHKYLRQSDNTSLW